MNLKKYEKEILIALKKDIYELVAIRNLVSIIISGDLTKIKDSNPFGHFLGTHIEKIVLKNKNTLEMDIFVAEIISGDSDLCDVCEIQTIEDLDKDHLETVLSQVDEIFPNNFKGGV